MENKYLNSSKIGEQLIWKFIEERREEKKLTIERLGEMVGLTKGNYSRYKNGHVSVPLKVILSICGALELNPYLVPRELDDNDKNYIHFN